MRRDPYLAQLQLSRGDEQSDLEERKIDSEKKENSREMHAHERRICIDVFVCIATQSGAIQIAP